jgi:hypothetical protein
MNSIYFIIAVVVIFVLLSLLLALIFSRRNRTKKLHSQFGTEYDHTVEAMGSKKKAQTELESRQNHVKTLNIRPLSMQERSRYMSDWTAIQAKFVDEPGQSIINADHLIMEVLQLLNYPISDFEQRAADVSVVYPEVVSNYRAAHAIAIKSEQKLANTEELRKAMIHYRSLFTELLGKESEAVG